MTALVLDLVALRLLVLTSKAARAKPRLKCDPICNRHYCESGAKL